MCDSRQQALGLNHLISNALSEIIYCSAYWNIWWCEKLSGVGKKFQKHKLAKSYFSIITCNIYLFYISWAFYLVLFPRVLIRHIPLTSLFQKRTTNHLIILFLRKKTYFSITSLSIRLACWLSIFFSFDTFLAWSSVGSLGPFELDAVEFFVVFFEDILPGGTWR